MNVCQRTKQLIDQSHRVDVLPIEASVHLETCQQCSSFAGERAALRHLLSSGERVTAPADFEARLNRRLADLKGRRRGQIWLNPALYLRVTLATAALIVAAVLVPGFFRPADQKQVPSSMTAETPQYTLPENIPVPVPTVQPGKPLIRSVRSGLVKTVRLRPHPVSRSDTYLGSTEGGVILLRGNGGDIEMPVRTVSLGAQPLLYGPEGGQAVRLVKASF